MNVYKTADLYKEMTTVLSWRKSAAGFDHLLPQHLAAVQKKLAGILSQSHLVSQETRRVATQLNARSIARLLTSPNVAEVAYMLEEELSFEVRRSLMKQLSDFIVAEAILQGVAEITSHSPIWTSTSDHVLDSDTKQILPALSTCTGAIIDYNGYFHNIGLEGISGYTYDEAQVFKAKIDEALECIRFVSPVVYSFVEGLTVHIQLRHNKAIYQSNGSSHIGIGKICSDNFHLIAHKPTEVIDFLVHESIHSFLHLIEETYFSFCDRQSSRFNWIGEKFVRSPWSGNKVDLPSYTHAILVWYGMFNFWIEAAKYDEGALKIVSRAEAGIMMRRSAKGFLTEKSLFDHIKFRLDAVRPSFCNLADHVQSEVQQNVA